MTEFTVFILDHKQIYDDIVRAIEAYDIKGLNVMKEDAIPGKRDIEFWRDLDLVFIHEGADNTRQEIVHKIFSNKAPEAGWAVLHYSRAGTVGSKIIQYETNEKIVDGSAANFLQNISANEFEKFLLGIKKNKIDFTLLFNCQLPLHQCISYYLLNKTGMRTDIIDTVLLEQELRKFRNDDPTKEVAQRVASALNEFYGGIE